MQRRVHSRVIWIDSLNGSSFSSGQYRGSDAFRKTNWTRTSLGKFNSFSQAHALTTEHSETLFIPAVEREDDRVPRSLVNPKNCVLKLEARVTQLFVSHDVFLASKYSRNKLCDIYSPTSCCTVPILDNELFHAGYIHAPHLAYAPPGDSYKDWSIFTKGLQEGKILSIGLIALSRTHGTFALTTDVNRQIAFQEERCSPPLDDSDVNLKNLSRYRAFDCQPSPMRFSTRGDSSLSLGVCIM